MSAKNLKRLGLPGSPLLLLKGIKMAGKKQASKEVNSLDQALKDVRKHLINEPTIQYAVGQRVQRGAVKQSIITEILDGGRVLKLHEICTENNYGNPYDYERDDYVPWHNVTQMRLAGSGVLS